jgi:hypothetical protein
MVIAEPITSTRNGSRFKRGATSGRRTADVFARAAAQLYDFVLRVTDIPAQETTFRTCRRNVMNTTFHSYRAPAWSGLKRYFVKWRKRALIRREQRMLSDHQWEDIIPLTPPAHDV